MNTQVNHARAAMDVLAALKGEAAPPPVETAPAKRAARHARRTEPVIVAEAPAAVPVAAVPVAAAAPTAPSGVATPSTVLPQATTTAAAPAGRRAAPAPAAAAPSTTRLDELVVRPRTGARRLAGALLLVVAPATAVATWAALTLRDTTLGGIALILGALAMGLWFMRVITVPTSVALLGPHLEVRRGDERYVWDLASAYSPVDHVRGRPGRSGWRVIMRNPDGSTFTIDGSMVPAKRFSEILARYRPEL